MTAAMVRVCNSCKNPFIKEYGCNHMVCDCGNNQCFVCSENINPRGDGHFGGLPGTCPQFDNTEQRLRMEVASAQNNIVREILEGQTEWTEAEVTVDVTLPSAIEFQQLERARQDEIERQEINRILARRAAEQAERARVQRERVRAQQERARVQKARAKRVKARRRAQKEESERQERIREARRAKRQRRRQRKKAEEKELEEQRNQRQRRGQNKRNRNR